MESLFTHFQLGAYELPNRFVMSSPTRLRSPEGQADDNTADYYSQRAGAGLIITEGLPVSAQGNGFIFTPGIYTSPQVASWIPVTEAVHASKGKIIAQLVHVGRVSHTSLQPEGGLPVSSVAEQGGCAFSINASGEPGLVKASKPRALTTPEIKQIVSDFKDAARNAMSAGFDSVEIQAAGGYLIEQFLNPVLNVRTDKYGALSIADRSRLLLEITDAVSTEIGSENTGIRLAPCNQSQGMALYPDIAETYTHIVREINNRTLSYVHLSVNGPVMFDGLFRKIRQICQRPLIVSGGLTVTQGECLISDNLADLVGFSSPFVSNPDFVERIRNGWPLAPVCRTQHYGGGKEGYTDYPCYCEHN